MLHTMAEKVHAGSKTVTQLNHANDYISNAWTMSKGQLFRQLEMAQKDNDKLYNENQHYKNRCLELLEKLQAYQEKEHPTEPKILRIAI